MARESSFQTARSAAPRPAAAPLTLGTDRVFLLSLAALYTALSLAMLFTMDRFWSANWDVEIILQATRSLWDGGSPFDLYEVSRATWPWPFPYPPHAALLLVPFIAAADWLAGGAASGWPALIAIRFPVILADVAIAWLLHRILLRHGGPAWLARLGAVAWLLSPVLFYHTAVQAHQESTWMLPVLLAYDWLERRERERLWIPLLLLVVAISLKQSAVLYAAPVGLMLLAEQRGRALLLFGGLFALIFGAVALPFHLYSDAFYDLVFAEVRRMPVQVQSWQVWTLALPGFLVEQTRTTFPTVRYAALLSLCGALLAGGWALRRGRSWFVVGLLATLAFLLFSQKVMAYHYPMLLPWLILVTFRAGRLRLATVGLIWSAWIVLSPYFAPWADPAHLPFYALLGTLNSALFLWIAIEAFRGSEEGTVDGSAATAGWLLTATLLLAAGFTLATVVQPLMGPLREGLAAAGAAIQLAGLLLLLAGVLLLTILLTALLAGRTARVVALPEGAGRLRAGHVGLALLFVPLFFTWFTMTAEVTAVIEQGLFAAWSLAGATP